MIVIGYEIEDILRVIIGIALGLLTIFRREMSCNREFHEEDTLGANENSHHLNVESELIQTGWMKNETTSYEQNNSKTIKRRNSFSSLPSLTSRRNTLEARKGQHSDATEELLEAASLFCSGGPFLAVFIAVYDHLLACVYVYALLALESVRSLVDSLRRDDENEIIRDIERVHDMSSPSIKQQAKEGKEKETEHVYNVAWNAATEYFSSISSKLDDTSQRTDWNKSASPTRSKSMGNLIQDLSNDTSRSLLIEMIAMANRRSMDVTLLPSDAQILICSYLLPKDLLSFVCTNKSSERMLDDSCENLDESSVCRDTALLIWKGLFIRDFAWILTDWNIGREALFRSMAFYNDEAIQQNQNHVFSHLMSIVMHSDEMWDEIEPFPPLTGNIRTPASMKEFYFLFSEVWINYTIAGCNTTDKCIIGLHGHIVDISDFVEDHPGSTETLLLQAGKDATVFFESMGHSRSARKLALGMVEVVNTQCINWKYAAASDRGRENKTCRDYRLLPPSSKLIRENRNNPGFLIPIKRSMPRALGGLQVMRSRLRQEQESELSKANRWVNGTLGSDALYGGVQVYFDPFCSCWRWWYTDLDFNPVFSESIDI